MLLAPIAVFLSVLITRVVCNTEQISFTYIPGTSQPTLQPDNTVVVLTHDRNRYIQAFAANSTGIHNYVVHAGAKENLNARVCWPASFPLNFEMAYANGVITVHYTPDFFTHKDVLPFVEPWCYEIILERPPLSGFFPSFFKQLAILLPVAVVTSGYLVRYF